MTLPTNTVTQYSTVGDREDLLDLIYDISPTETPFMNGIARSKASSVFHEWQTDSLDAAAANLALEGDDPTAKTYTATTRVGNYCQISQKTVIVSGTARAIDQAGRADELAYQVAKRGKELKRDMEFALTQNQASSAGGAGTARASAGLESWLSSNKTSEGTGTAQTTPGFASGTVAAPTDSTVAGTFEKSTLDAVIKECWVAGGDPTMIMVGPHNRTVISGFTGISTLETRADQGMDVTLMGAIDFYKSNYGTLKLVPNRFQRDQTAFVLDMDYFSVAYLRPMELNPLAKTGDSEKRQMLTEFTLCVKNEASSGKVTDLTVS
jgi:hypothetical protein